MCPVDLGQHRIWCPRPLMFAARMPGEVRYGYGATFGHVRRPVPSTTTPGTMHAEGTRNTYREHLSIRLSTSAIESNIDHPPNRVSISTYL